MCIRDSGSVASHSCDCGSAASHSCDRDSTADAHNRRVLPHVTPRPARRQVLYALGEAVVTGGRVDLPSSGLLEGDGMAALGTIQHATYSAVALSADIVSTVTGKYSAGGERRHASLPPSHANRIEGALSSSQDRCVACCTQGASGPSPQARTRLFRLPGLLTASEPEAGRRAAFFLVFSSYAAR
eukprot:4421823-Prymnesium_polylepis.1